MNGGIENRAYQLTVTSPEKQGRSAQQTKGSELFDEHLHRIEGIGTTN